MKGKVAGFDKVFQLLEDSRVGDCAASIALNIVDKLGLGEIFIIADADTFPGISVKAHKGARCYQFVQQGDTIEMWNLSSRKVGFEKKWRTAQ